MQVNDILGVAPLGTTDADLAAVNDFKLTNMLLANDATATSAASVTINGKELTAGMGDEKKLAKEDGEVMADTVGITAKDFDDFRAKVAAADSKLQAKIDAILEDIADIPSCA